MVVLGQVKKKEAAIHMVVSERFYRRWNKLALSFGYNATELTRHVCVQFVIDEARKARNKEAPTLKAVEYPQCVKILNADTRLKKEYFPIVLKEQKQGALTSSPTKSPDSQ